MIIIFDLDESELKVSAMEQSSPPPDSGSDRQWQLCTLVRDRHLGGKAFTDIILREFYQEQGIREAELSPEERAYYYRQARECKSHFEAGIFYRMQTVSGDERLETLFLRGAFEKMSMPLLERIKDRVREGMAKAGIKKEEIEEVILTGEASQTLFIRKFVGKLFGRVPDSRK